jgi:DNA-binding PadR family transcriptional regulator
LYACRTKIHEEKNKKMNHPQKEAQTKLTKGLLDLIVLQLLRNEPMHGYQIITSIRRKFGVYFGPSTVYPMLNLLEKKKHVKSEWNMNHERPRKVYTLTNQGQNLLTFTEESLNLICRTMSKTTAYESQDAIQTAPASVRTRRAINIPTFSK